MEPDLPRLAGHTCEGEPWHVQLWRNIMLSTPCDEPRASSSVMEVEAVPWRGPSGQTSRPGM
uniref:Uncharacterized protein n=1 Tax=Setaria italica TaxID=4555 RepID=K3ZBM7_SETIT